jgi:hypothetical protein
MSPRRNSTHWSPAASAFPSAFEELARKIDRDHLAVGADGLGHGQRGGAGATAHIQHMRPAMQSQPLDGPLAIPCPEPQGLGVEVLGSGIVGRLGFEFGCC